MNYTNYRCETCEQNCYVDESTKEVADSCPFCKGVLYLIGTVICNPDSLENS